MKSKKDKSGIPSPYPLDEGALKRLNPAAFTKLVRDIAKEIHPQWKVDIAKDLELNIAFGSYSGVAYLANLYASCLKELSRKEQIIREYLRQLEGMERMFGPVSPENIVPIIKDRDFANEIHEAHQKNRVSGKTRFVEEPLNETLVILYAVNSEKTFRFLHSEDLAKLRMEAKNLRELAIKNLRRLLPSIEIQQHPKLTISSIRAGGTFESSLLLLDEIWEKRRFCVSGDIIVGIPRRDTLLVTDSREPALVENIRRVCRRLASSGQYPVTDQLFVRRGDRFVEF